MKAIRMAGPGGSLWTEVDGELHVVSKCGLYCDTCPAFRNGLCNGCPRLEMDDCVVRDCAHRRNVATCQDCELDSCYHFEAYTIRRQLMRERTKALLRRTSAGGAAASACSTGCGGGGCGGCQSRGASGGCSGCASSSAAGGCAAVRMLEALAKVE